MKITDAGKARYFGHGLHPKLKVEAVETYQETKYLQDPAFSKLMQTAENLVESFRQGNLPTSKVFDVDKMAKLYALLDLAGESHTLGFDNMRFYLNPVTSLLEPIAYDNQLMGPLSDKRRSRRRPTNPRRGTSPSTLFRQ